MHPDVADPHLTAQAPGAHAHSGEPHLTPRLCVVIWAALMGLLFLTLALGEVPLGKWNFFISFAIAMVKAVLIVLFFMHVRYSHGLIRIVAFAGFFWFAIMLGLTFADYMSRGWLQPEVFGPAPNVPGTGFDKP